MGERKGQNFYYPPDFDYKKHKSLNRYHGTHALRERAKKISQGILVIRFEMPFNIWCLGCNNHVGMGVRYNAEKKKIGMYYTTPLYEFRMKCHLCDNYFVIRTDPKNFDYELVEGCTRQEKRFEPSEIDQVDTSDSDFSHKLAADAMFKTEHQEEDKSKATNEESRMEKIEWVQERLRDDFAANQALRAQFRKEKKELTEKRARDDDLRARCSLSIPLVPEDPHDKKVAGMLSRYRTVKCKIISCDESPVKAYDERQEERRTEITSKRIFSSSSAPSTSSADASAPSSIERLKNSIRRDRDRRIIDSDIAGDCCQTIPPFSKNGRMKKLDELMSRILNEYHIDPRGEFESGPAPKKSSLSLGIVRKTVKQELGEDEEEFEMGNATEAVSKEEKKEENGAKPTCGLVADYDSSGSE